MFVDQLNHEQQGILLKLGGELIAADGNIHENETTLLAALKAQMAPDVTDEASENIAVSFASQRSKVALLLELLGLAHADSEYHLNEKDYVVNIAEQLGVDMEKLAEMESWVLRQFALVREAEQLMED